MKYKVGDIVTLPIVRPRAWSISMDKYLGKTITITEIYENTYFSFANSEGWSFLLEELPKQSLYPEIY